MTEKESMRPSEIEKYKRESEQIKKEIIQASENVKPYLLHMQARHIEGLHKLYKEKLGYTGVGDIDSMKQFKHDYFAKKEHHQDIVDFLTDFHVHRALLAYGVIKTKKPIPLLSQKEFNEVTNQAKAEAIRLREEEKAKYNELLQEYAGVSAKKIAGTLQEFAHQFPEAYAQKIIQPAIQKHYHERLDVELGDIINKITPIHEYYDPELKEIIQQIKQQKQQLAYMRAMEGEELEEENYQLPDLKTLEQMTNKQEPEAKLPGQVAPTPGAPTGVSGPNGA